MYYTIVQHVFASLSQGQYTNYPCAVGHYCPEGTLAPIPCPGVRDAHINLPAYSISLYRLNARSFSWYMLASYTVHIIVALS
jgi:hypothetical protein